jgi:hypothetical protein
VHSPAGTGSNGQDALSKQAIATCSTGKNILGGGGQIRSADLSTELVNQTDIAIVRAEPIDNVTPNRFLVRAVNLFNNNDQDWRLRVVAICGFVSP